MRKSVEGITVISASIEGRGLGHSDGCVRYDEPGMHPMQKAEVMFVPENIENAFQPPSYAREFMTRHADRTLIVRHEEPVPVIPDPDAGKVRNVCDSGHFWMSLPNEEIDVSCGEWSGRSHGPRPHRSVECFLITCNQRKFPQVAKIRLCRALRLHRPSGKRSLSGGTEETGGR